MQRNISVNRESFCILKALHGVHNVLLNCEIDLEHLRKELRNTHRRKKEIKYMTEKKDMKVVQVSRFLNYLNELRESRSCSLA